MKYGVGWLVIFALCHDGTPGSRRSLRTGRCLDWSGVGGKWMGNMMNPSVVALMDYLMCWDTMDIGKVEMGQARYIKKELGLEG